MPVWKLQTQIAVQSLFPHDQWVITPHVDDSGVTTDPQGLCEDWAAAMALLTGDERQIVVRAYDAQGSKPVYPQGEATENPGLCPPGRSPGEVALCLSFYSTRNIPRQRGRLYLPIAAQFAALGPRPVPIHWDYAQDYATALQALGGADVDWVVFSKMDDEARPVTNWWCDDEWDTMRSRGLGGTDRRLGTTSEG